MTQAEKESIEAFCRELALALRRITGKNIVIPPEDLPRPVENDRDQPAGSKKPDEEPTK